MGVAAPAFREWARRRFVTAAISGPFPECWRREAGSDGLLCYNLYLFRQPGDKWPEQSPGFEIGKFRIGKLG